VCRVPSCRWVVTGRHTPAVTKVLQLAGLLTVLTLGALIGFALHRERHGKCSTSSSLPKCRRDRKRLR